MRYTFDEAEDNLLKAIQWIEKQGISTDRTRFRKYLKILKGGIIGFEKDIGKFFNAVLEINELLEIQKGFRNITLGEAYKEKLRKYSHGPENYFEEGHSKNNQARDYGFELAISSQFAGSGFTIDTSLAGADLITSYGGKTWFIECKRPRKETSVRSNTRGAYNQLIRRFGSCEEPSFGLVAISMTKAKMNELLVAVNASNQETKALAKEILKRIVDEHATRLGKLISRPPEIVGLIFRLIVPYWDTKSGEIGTYTGHSIVSFYPDGTKEREALINIATAISNQELEIRTYG